MSKKNPRYNGLRDNAADPIRDNKYILEILDLLKDNPRDQTLFMVGISTNLRGCDLVKVLFQSLGKIGSFPSVCIYRFSKFLADFTDHTVTW